MKNLQRIIKVVLVLNVVFFGLFGRVALCQNVGINETNPDNSALLEMTSTEMGLLVPRMTAVERDAIVDPANGLIIYNINDSCLNLYRYDYWYNMCCCDNDIPPIPPICGEGFVTEVVDVVSAGQTWMDRNLGAIQQATALDDYLAFGSLFQWGRLSDGHECLTWVSSTETDGAEQSNETTTLSSTDVPGHSDFILSSSEPYDWRSPQNDLLWQGVNGVNNPCPSGYRLPTSTECQVELSSWTIATSAGAYNSPLKFTVPSYRSAGSGVIWFYGPNNHPGFYHTSTVSGINILTLHFYETAAISSAPYRRGSGFSVRCIKD